MAEGRPLDLGRVWEFALSAEMSASAANNLGVIAIPVRSLAARAVLGGGGATRAQCALQPAQNHPLDRSHQEDALVIDSTVQAQRLFSVVQAKNLLDSSQKFCHAAVGIPITAKASCFEF
jgi:hypothetical protein